MSPKAKSVYRCTECGADHPKWAGRCDVCGAWNSLVEEMATKPAPTGGASRRAGAELGDSPDRGVLVAVDMWRALTREVPWLIQERDDADR